MLGQHNYAEDIPRTLRQYLLSSEEERAWYRANFVVTVQETGGLLHLEYDRLLEMYGVRALKSGRTGYGVDNLVAFSDRCAALLCACRLGWM